MYSCVVGVTKHFLYRAQILRRLQHVARKTVAQDVRVHMGRQTGQNRQTGELGLHNTGADPSPAGT